MPRVENLVFFTEGAFSGRDYTRYGIAPLQEEGFRVEAWDLSRVLHPDAVPPGQPPVALPGGFLPRQFTGKGELLRAIGEMSPATLVNCFVGYSVPSLFIYRALSKRRIPYAVTATNAIPPPGRITRPPGPDLPGKILSRLVQTAILGLYPLLGVQPAFLCLAGGERSLGSLRYPVDFRGGRTTLLPVHTLDYDLYLASRGLEPPAQENFGVFLDGNDFHHQDLRFMKEPVPEWMDAYFSQLRGFFDVLERELGTRIVVAAHPEAQYTPEQKAQFGEREVVQGRTADLVRRCRFAVLHASTAVNLAVLFGKPLLFLTNENYRTYVMGPYIEAIARQLGKEPVSLDNPPRTDPGQLLRVDGDAYARYRRLYIKAEGSEDKPSWAILAGFLKSLR